MDFQEVRFPIEISAWMVGGPQWNTRVYQSQDGDETPLSLWAYPLHKWQITNAAREVANAAALKRFQLRVRGRAYAFRVWDPLDYSTVAGEGVLLATATPHVFQLAKVYGGTDGDVALVRKILKPVPGTVTVFDASSGAVAGAPVDAKTGLVTLAGVSDASTYSWTGFFDVPAGFGEDWLQQGMSMDGALDVTGMTINECRRVDASIGTPPALVLPFYDPSVVIPTTSPAPPPPPPAATAIVVGAHPTTGTVGVASDPFHFGLDGTPAAPVHVTLHAFGSSGEESGWSPSTITLSSPTDDMTATYTAASAGSKTLTRTNDRSLDNGYNLSFNATATPSPSPPPPPPAGSPSPTPVALNAGTPATFSGSSGDVFNFSYATFSHDAVTLTLATAGLNSGATVLGNTRWFHADAWNGTTSLGTPDGTLAGSGTASVASGAANYEYFSITLSASVTSGSITVTPPAAPPPPPASGPSGGALTSGVTANFAGGSGDAVDFYIDTTTATNLHLVITGAGSSGSYATATTAWKHGAVAASNPPTSFPDGALSGSGSADIPATSGREYFRISPNTVVSGTITVTAT